MSPGKKNNFQETLVYLLSRALSQKKLVEMLRFITVKTFFAKEDRRITALMIDQAFPEEKQTDNGNTLTEQLQEAGLIQEQTILSQPSGRNNIFFSVTALYRALPKELLYRFIENDEARILTNTEIHEILK